jgi:branched-chain amino acid transport system permease protein
MAIRDMDIAAELIGIRPLNAKLTAFGLGSIMGSLVGAAFILILPIVLNLIPTQLGVPLSTETITHLEFIIFGSLICYLLIKEPHGFARLISLGKEKLRLWPFPY